MLPVNEAQEQLPDLIDAVNRSHEPIVIAGQNKNAVLLSEADWAGIQETLYLLSIPGMRESIREGLATPIEDCNLELLEEAEFKQFIELLDAPPEANEKLHRLLKTKAPWE